MTKVLSTLHATILLQRFYREHIKHWLMCLNVLNKINYGKKIFHKDDDDEDDKDDDDNDDDDKDDDDNDDDDKDDDDDDEGEDDDDDDEDDDDYIDVRETSRYKHLSPRGRTFALVNYTEQQISNLYSFYDLELSNSRCNNALDTLTGDYYCENLTIMDFADEQPKRYAFANIVSSLILAKSDLECEEELYWYKEAFAGVEFDPFKGSSFMNSMGPVMFDELAPFTNESFTEALEQDEKLDLLGPMIANRVDVMYKVRMAFIKLSSNEDIGKNKLEDLPDDRYEVEEY